MAITKSTASPKNTLATPFLLVVPILVLVLYLLPFPGVLAGKLIGDGEQLTSRNEQVTAPFSWQSVWLSATPSHAPARQAYRPVLAHLLRMEYQAWQESPSSYHAVSLILYLGVVSLFLLLGGRLMKLTGARLAAGAVLALHPMGTQAVANVAGQGVLLSLLAVLGALYLFQLCRAGKLALGWASPLIALLSAVAVGSHEMGLLLPLWLVAVAWLTDEAPAPRAHETPKGKRTAKAAGTEAASVAAPFGSPVRVLALVLPLAAVVAGYLSLRATALGGVTPSPLAALGSAFAHGPAIFAAYLGRLCWPSRPTYFYLLAEQGAVLPHPLVGWIVLLAALALAVWACRRWRALGLGLVLMLTPLAALAHFIPLASFMSEQPLVFALPGFCLAAGALAERLAGAWGAGRLPRMRQPAVASAFAVMVGLACLALAVQTFVRVRQWASPEALWAAETALHPASAQPLIEQLDASVRVSNSDMARRFAREARRKATGAELDRVIELEALLAANIKDDDRLKELIDEALDEKRQPGMDTLGRVALFARDREFRSESVSLWRRALKLYPDDFDALYELAQVELDNKNFKEAIHLGGQAVSAAQKRGLSSKMWGLAQERYGIILAEAGQTQPARITLEQALASDNTLYHAYIYLARIFWGAKEYQQARGVLEACFMHVGANLTSYIDLAQLYTGILEDQNMKRQALDWIQVQMAAFPRDTSLQVWGALYLVEAGFYDRAYQTYQALTGTQMSRDDKAQMLVGMGMLALRGNRQPSEAARIWRSALQFDPANENAKRLLESLEQPAAETPAAKAPVAAAKAATTSATAVKTANASAVVAKTATTSTTTAKAAVVATPVPVTGAGLTLGVPFAGMSVSRPNLATSASKPLTPPAAPAK